MPPARTQAEFEQQEQRHKLANSYQSLLSEFSSSDLRNVGNYALGRLIGKGSFGRVYLAQHKLTNGSKVVLKSANKSDPNLAREIHHHRQFLHPHIARLYEVIVTESLVWLVLEWCPGDELYHHLLEHGRMEPAKVQKIFTQLVGAVSYVHSKSCVHRDLKLENILLDKHGNVKLVDFGFTREYHGTTSHLQTWCGTVCYSAPEMLRGEKYAGEKVDVWSLGIILYALLCGELPYDEEEESDTKKKILNEDPKYPDHIPDGVRELLKKMLSKRTILRPSLADLLKDPWLAEHAPHQQEILKVQQPTPFSTQLEKDTLQRMRSAGVNIDMVIEHVLAQRCDALAGWWALLIEKEQRKERRREQKRKERDAESRSIRRLSAASSKLFALGEIQEGEVVGMPSSRGRTMARINGTTEVPSVPELSEAKSYSPRRRPSGPRTPRAGSGKDAVSPSRPAPPPKDLHQHTANRRPRTTSRSSGSMLRVVQTANDSDLLSPSYVPPPQRKRRPLMQQPLKEQIAWVKHWFKESAYKRSKSPNDGAGKKGIMETPKIVMNGGAVLERGNTEGGKGILSSNLPDAPKRISFEGGVNAPSRVTTATRPRINTSSNIDSRSATQRKRQSLSPRTLTPHSSIRRPSAGLHGRKSTSSSISSIRSAYQAHHQHTHSKASSTSSASVASPSGLSATSGSRITRSPHSSVKMVPSTQTTSTLPSNIRVSKRPPVSSLGTVPPFGEPRMGFASVTPGSPSVPVFARRKRSVFRGPGLSSSPAGFGRIAMNGSVSGRSGSVPRRTSSEIPNIYEEDEEVDNVEGEEEDAVEEVDYFGAEEGVPGSDGEPVRDASIEAGTATEPATPLEYPSESVTPAPTDGDNPLHTGLARSGTPLTAEALAKMQEQHDVH